MSPLTRLGIDAPGGAYLLRLVVERPLPVTFGRFNRGRPVTIPAGAVVYAGSALGRRGPLSLARRLARHASRSGDQTPHPLLAALLAQFPEAAPRRPKRLHWHVDYLLDRPEVALTHAIAIGAAEPLEGTLAVRLAADPATFPLADGLGATDAPGQTHLWGAPVALDWWTALATELGERFGFLADERVEE